MDFDLTSEQIQLRDGLRRYLSETYSFSAYDEASRRGPGWRPEVWKALAQDLDLLGAGLPTSVGGSGGGFVETMLICGELGQVLALEPYIETVVTCGGLLLQAGSDQANSLLKQMVAGQSIMAFGWAEVGASYNPAEARTRAVRYSDGWRLSGRKSMVMAAPWADYVILTAQTEGQGGAADGLSLFLVKTDHPGLEMKPYPSVDGRRAADLILSDVHIGDEALLGQVGQALPGVEQIIDQALAAAMAEAVGILRRMLADTVAYTGQRCQFGKPLSDLQVLQHRMVDMFMQVEAAEAAILLATLNLEAPARERARAVSAAKVTVSEACRFVGENAIQLHGGMGMTDELPLGRYFKRAMALDAEYGSSDFHLHRYNRWAAS